MVKTHVGPPLREAGFKGSAPTWRLRSPAGDVAIVNLQKSSYNDGDEVNFYVNLAVLPAAWWEYLIDETPQRRPANPVERDGLLRRRLDPPVKFRLRDGWVVGGADDADDGGIVLGEQLEQVAIPELRALLDPGGLAAFVEGDAPGWWVTRRKELALAYAVAGEGMTPRLQRVLDDFDRSPHDPRDAKQAAWLRRR
ncbi:DUF4304 domain-containing protein [Actinoplanes sp. LDG1-06]|uniref:DUF4304 domain-containing protein n=1 Tax=Paractinoplanes ovalisporus TaxID=2810368 RepID=A0ABS2ALD7_9ACTN|nr:DUF4304 domain-containing protein [Actinoplanes ovalisporus]MBM2620611.1 DUF4304 domain-containing protein [Actinoplanes ovalisporus]